MRGGVALHFQGAAPMASVCPPVSMCAFSHGQMASQSASFFRAAKVALDLGQRALTEDELEPVTALLRQHGMTLALVRTLSLIHI